MYSAGASQEGAQNQLLSQISANFSNFPRLDSQSLTPVNGSVAQI